MAVTKCRLYRRQLAVSGRDALDGRDLRTLNLHREHQAGPHCRPVEQHRAGTARAVLATQVRAGQAASIAEEIGQGQPRLDDRFKGNSVDRQLDQTFMHRMPP
jgi:hypothetical protein